MNERVGLYSSSLYSAACEAGVSREVYDSLKVVMKVLRENGEYEKIVSSANLRADERVGLIEEAFSAQVHLFCLNFMKMLAKKRIFNIIIPCIEEYEKQYLKDNNITYATITTAVELSDERKKAVTEKIALSAKKTVVPKFVVNKDIVGGIVIETDSSSIDASVRGKLQSIERYISKK